MKTKESMGKNLLCEAASAVRCVENLIVEDGEVKRKPQSYGMSGCQVRRGSVLVKRIRIRDIRDIILHTTITNLSRLVSHQSTFGRFLPICPSLELSKVPM